jgi:CubicO group peptidase (beta-lactamase class C family)
VSRHAGAAEIRRLLLDRVDDGFTAGAAWRVEGVEGVEGAVARGAVGWAVLEPARVPLDSATPFDLASLTKPLCTALLLALLEADGTIDPRRPAADWLEELERSWVGRASLLDLATHTAGLPAWVPLYTQARGAPGYLEAIARLEPAVAPGRTLYSDLGYIVLGLALERAAGETLDRLFAARISRPLGLARLAFAVGGARYDDAAATERGNEYERRMAGEVGAGHAFRQGLLRGEVHDGNAHGLAGVAGHAGLFGTADDVAALGREILEPRVLPLGGDARRRLLEPRSPCGGRTVGFVLASHAGAARGILPDRAPGHTGFTGTSLWLDAGRGAIYVLLANRVHPAVGPRDFRVVRRAFHRLASRLAPGEDAGPPLQ